MDNLAIIETILRNRYRFFTEIREGQEVSAKIRDMVISAAIFFALYGAVIGSTSPHWQQVLASAVKLPVLFLITLIICLPSLYFFNLFFGSRLTFFQTLRISHILHGEVNRSGMAGQLHHRLPRRQQCQFPLLPFLQPKRGRGPSNALTAGKPHADDRRQITNAVQ